MRIDAIDSLGFPIQAENSISNTHVAQPARAGWRLHLTMDALRLAGAGIPEYPEDGLLARAEPVAHGDQRGVLLG